MSSVDWNSDTSSGCSMPTYSAWVSPAPGSLPTIRSIAADHSIVPSRTFYCHDPRPDIASNRAHRHRAIVGP